MSFLSYLEVFCLFTFRPSDIIETLTNVRMDNFCPCFIYLVDNNKK